MLRTPTTHAPALPGSATGLPTTLILLFSRTALLFAAAGVLYALSATGVLDPWPRPMIWLNIAIVAVDVITLVLVTRVLHREGRTLRELFAWRASDLGWSLLVLVILTVALFAATFVANLVVYGGAPPMPAASGQPPLWYGLWTVLIMPVTIALAEEFLYRGWAQPALTQRWGRWIAWLVVAVAFGAQHIALSLTSPEAAASRFLAMFLCGLVFGALYWRFRRLAPLIIAHWLLDVLFLGLPNLV